MERFTFGSHTNHEDDNKGTCYPTATPSENLYEHYAYLLRKQHSFDSIPGVRVCFNTNGTEFDPLSLKTKLDNVDNPDPVVKRTIEDFVQNDHYWLEEEAKKIAEVFRVDYSSFNAHHDRLGDIYAGNLSKVYTYSALRSFAWTLAADAEAEGRDITDYSEDELVAIIDYVAGENWLNYEDSGDFKALCDQPDIHVLYVPESLMTKENARRLQKNLMCAPAASITAFRECLSRLKPVISILAERLSIGRDHTEQLTGDIADVVYAWCALCVAAKEPFFIYDGPMMCSYDYPGDRAQKMEYIGYISMAGVSSKEQADQWLNERNEKNTEIAAKIDRSARITFAGKHFVLSGFMDGDETGEMARRIQKAGGLIHSKMVKMADYLVIDMNSAVIGKSKFNKALEMREKGSAVKIVTADMTDAALKNG